MSGANANDDASMTREIALSLPATEERITWGHPTLRVHDSIFLTLTEDGSTASIKTGHDEQAMLIDGDPDTFFRPAYVGRHGWVGVRPATADPAQLEELIVEAWRRTAPVRLVRAFDAGPGGSAGAATR